MKIESKRLILRNWEDGDVKDIVDGLNNLEVSKWMAGVPFPYTENDARADFYLEKAAVDKPTITNNTAENTGLDDNSVDLITVAQALHYFDVEKVKIEFRRILKLNGKVALLWNFRYKESDFMKEYEKIVYTFHSKDLQPTFAQDKMNDSVYNKLFSEYKVFSIPYIQELDFDDLWGRVLSSNHAPKKDDPNYDELYKNIKKIFDKYQHNKKINFEYHTKVVIGNIN